MLITLIAFMMILLSNSAIGQTAADSIKINKYIYCELVGNQKILSYKVTVSIDYGEEKGFFQDTRMRNEQTGKVQTFNSMIDALNYMGNNGWEFVQAYIVTTGQQNVYHWLLKKKRI